MTEQDLALHQRFYSDRNGTIQRVKIVQIRRARVLIEDMDDQSVKKLSKSELLKKYNPVGNHG